MLKGYIFFFRNAEGVHGKRKVGNTCSNIKASTHYALTIISQRL